ncbi:MAG: carbamoyl phosphate synthase small subunit [Oscillospiraceae bacterium]
MIKTDTKAWLLLEDGSLFEGKSFGAQGSSIGEVVFSTSMVGYQEALTDPNYLGQILTQTFPLIGNYGINHDNPNETSYMHGYIVREWCDNPSNFRSEENIDEFMKAHNIIGLCGIDTRHLTKTLREKGTMNGLITTQPISDIGLTIKKIAKYTVKNAIQTVMENTPLSEPLNQLGSCAKFKIGILNLGSGSNLKKEFESHDCDTILFHPSQTAKTILESKVDGIVFSEGPGNPSENKEVLETIRTLIASGIPLMGIGLGHQMLALVCGAKTKKMLHGHRGANQPVIDTLTGKAYITTQNHGYVVDKNTVDSDIAYVRYINANDKSCEGLVYKDFSALSVQFRPEGNGSAQETSYLYDDFISMIERQSK